MCSYNKHSKLVALALVPAAFASRRHYSPLVVEREPAGGASRSRYSWRAPRSALHTWGEVEVVHSTRAGYSAITWLQMFASTGTQSKGHV